MWTVENRSRYDPSGLRYPSDLTDAEWALVAPLIPGPKRGGNKRTVEVCEVVNGLMYILSTGCQWRALPKDLAPRSTVHDYFARWDWDGTLVRIHEALYRQCREQVGRGQKIKGKKRHVLVDTQGLLMHAIVHAADVQDRDGGVLLMATLFGVSGGEKPRINGASFV